MSRTRTALLEWLSPGRVHRAAIPPFEAGLRPNSRLEDAEVLAVFDPLTLEDVILLGQDIVVSVGNQLLRHRDHGEFEVLAELEGPAGALTLLGDDIVVAVAGQGLVRVDAAGVTRIWCADPRVRSCVTAIATQDDETLLVTVGSITTDEWARSLLTGVADGLLLRVQTSVVDVVDEELPWPSGVAVDPSGERYLVALSIGHRIEERSFGGDGVVAVRGNLPGYPGRVRPAVGDDGWVVAMPYMRNRATELLLEEPRLVGEMMAQMEPDAWLVPRLAVKNLYRAPLQVGRIRVLGEIKPWAPPQTYGLVFDLGSRGDVRSSAHSRTDGSMHGVTGVARATDGSTIVACRGAGKLLRVPGKA